MATNKATTKKTVKPKEKLRKATLHVMGKQYQGEGKSVYDALASIDVRGVAGKTVLVVDDKERVLPTLIVKRAFLMAGASREAALKTISSLFV